MRSKLPAEASTKTIKTPTRAAQYVRMSTDYQKYSTENQSEANQAYAALHGIQIVRTYTDSGRSGLTIRARPALTQLIADVQAGQTEFTAILVYDVSRWGRFQDTDESSYYEFVCKRAGVPVHYCAEPFENDGTSFAAIIKSIKRAMAAEYSRELSIKTFVGKANLVRRGFRVGSSPPYGTRRLLIDASGTAKLILDSGQLKSLQNDRIVLVPGPSEEVRIVRRIFLAFVNHHKPESLIAKELNDEGLVVGLPRPWTYARVRWLLRNEVYAGDVVWNRTSAKLRTKKIHNDPEQWIRGKCFFAPIIERSQFDAAQAIFRKRLEPYPKEQVLESIRRVARERGFLDGRLVENSRELPSVRRLYGVFGGIGKVRDLIGATSRPGPPYHFTDNELMVALRRLLRRKGRLTRHIIQACRDLPCPSVYEHRFGSLSRAYQLIGYDSGRANGRSNERLLEALQKLLRKKGQLSMKLIDRSKTCPSSATYRARFGSLVQAYRLISYEGTYWNQRKPPSCQIEA
jgi:DNA invertase Pin-like site-specific DNA recombinase